MKRKLIGLLLVVVIAVTLMFPVAAFATNPTVSITVSAKLIAITNSQPGPWAMGPVEVNNTRYFSANNLEDDDYSMITNTGNVAVDVAIQGVNIEGGDYDWTLSNAGAPGDQIYSLHANKQATPTVYDVIVKSSDYNNITAADGLAVLGTNYWSMKFTAPTAFNAADPGTGKTATVTLVASEHP